MTAAETLRRAAQHIEDRAAARDQPQGERSMARAVAAFNALTGHQLTERDGWLFMVTLKAARACTTATGQPDDYEDLSAYAALAAESAAPAPTATPWEAAAHLACPFPVPEGCTHVAQDADGSWWAFAGAPTKDVADDMWDAPETYYLGQTAPNPNWIDTLSEVAALPAEL